MVEARFEPLAYMLLNGLPDLAYEAWAELEGQHPDEPYSPNWEQYQEAESSDCLRFIALRDRNKLLGYASIIIKSDDHRANVRVAYFKDIFITRAKRGHAAFFVRFIEKQIAALGVQRVVAEERLDLPVPNNAGAFYEQMGFRPSGTIWSKVLN